MCYDSDLVSTEAFGMLRFPSKKLLLMRTDEGVDGVVVNPCPHQPQEITIRASGAMRCSPGTGEVAARGAATESEM